MLSLKWSLINKEPFMAGIIALNNAPRLEAKTAYRVGRIFEACKVAMNEYRSKEKAMVEEQKLFDVNEDGTRKLDPDGSPTIKPEHKEAFVKGSEAIAAANQTNVKVCKLDFAQVSAAGLPGKCLIALADAGVLENLPGDESGEIEHKAVG
jgi:hypothetical protein